MALTKIFTGMELGPEAIDANFKEYFGADTGYQNTGITYANGAKAYDSNGVSYQMLSSTSGIGLITFGSISIPSTLIDSGNDPVPVVKFPSNVTVAGEYQWYATCSGGEARLMFSKSANAISIYPRYFIYNHEKTDRRCLGKRLTDTATHK